MDWFTILWIGGAAAVVALAAGIAIAWRRARTRKPHTDDLYPLW